MRYRFARPEGTRARLLNALPLRYMSAFTKRSGKNVRFVRFYPPPPPDYYTKGNALFAFTEAVAAGRRPGSATGAGSVGCLHDRHCTTLLFWCAAERNGAQAMLSLRARLLSHRWHEIPI